MKVINFDAKAEHIIEAPAEASKIILKGPTGSGKSRILMERYKYLVEKLRVPSEKILILLLNRTQSLEWKSKTAFEKSGAIWQTSYYGFIQDEIKTYYPVIVKNCGDIVNKRLKPVFAAFEAAHFLVSKAIEGRRETKGVFAGVTSFTGRIAMDLTANLVKAAMSGIPYDEIGSRLYNSLEIKDEAKRQMFEEADEILKAYRGKCMELGIFDFGMAVDIYHSCLLKDEGYKVQLCERIQHLIVDNAEECVPAEVDFIELLSPHLKTCLLGCNYEGGFGGNHEYMAAKLEGGFEAVELSGSHTCKDYLHEFSEMLFENIENLAQRKYAERAEIERTPVFELRSEMLEKAGECICRLIREDGYRPSDIAVISTYADPVTEFAIGGMLEKNGYKLKNIARKSRVIDNSLSQALMTFSQLCHPAYGIIPAEDDVKALIRTLFGIDPVRSSILAKEVCRQRPFAELPDVESPGVEEKIQYHNIEKYKYVRQWITGYKGRENPLEMDEFLQKAFLEVLISENISESDILFVKKLIDSARAFVDIVSRFKGMNAGKGFLHMAREGIKTAESIFELEESIHGEHIILSTPVTYLASTLTSKVIILISLSSSNWTPRSIKEMTNAHVLTRTWEDGDIYTEELEKNRQKHYIAILMRSLIKRCKDRLITFESALSAGGYENDGMLAGYFDELFL